MALNGTTIIWLSNPVVCAHKLLVQAIELHWIQAKFDKLYRLFIICTSIITVQLISYKCITVLHIWLAKVNRNVNPSSNLSPFCSDELDEGGEMLLTNHIAWSDRRRDRSVPQKHRCSNINNPRISVFSTAKSLTRIVGSILQLQSKLEFRSITGCYANTTDASNW